MYLIEVKANETSLRSLQTWSHQSRSVFLVPNALPLNQSRAEVVTGQY